MSKYEDQFDILPELELEISTGRAKPDISIFRNITFNWEEYIIRFTSPPITAIEILSPTQAFDELTTKIRKIYFPSGVQSAWIVVPSIKAVHLFLPNAPVVAFTNGKLIDPINLIELEIDHIFK